jgi:hypothetical protein
MRRRSSYIPTIRDVYGSFCQSLEKWIHQGNLWPTYQRWGRSCLIKLLGACKSAWIEQECAYPVVVRMNWARMWVSCGNARCEQWLGGGSSDAVICIRAVHLPYRRIFDSFCSLVQRFPTFFLSRTPWLGFSFMSTPSLHYPHPSLKKVFF